MSAPMEEETAPQQRVKQNSKSTNPTRSQSHARKGPMVCTADSAVLSSAMPTCDEMTGVVISMAVP